jgi:hypothetical protein
MITLKITPLACCKRFDLARVSLRPSLPASAEGLDSKLLLKSLNYIRLATGRTLEGILEDRSLPEVRAA